MSKWTIGDIMRIGLYHGYELTGSGSNEYTRYLARSLLGAGHEVHTICRDFTLKQYHMLHVHMPEMDGLDLCRAIRTSPTHQRLPQDLKFPSASFNFYAFTDRESSNNPQTPVP